MTSTVETWLKTRAPELGFDAVGIAAADAAPEAGPRLMQFLAEGRHGGMTWLADKAELRRSPQALWPQARSVVALAMSYAPGRDPLDWLARPDRGLISVYAQGRDYHDLLKARVKLLARELQAQTGGAELKVFVDTAPVMEKPLAAAAGIGWQGKHTNLVSRQHGSWLFLGIILTAAELVPDAAAAGHCGSCRSCLDVCPTDAFVAPYQLDARRCLAYLSIEYAGPIPLEFRAPMGNRVFGCDDCLAVCPWNKFAERTREARFAAHDGTANPPLAELLALDDAAFRRRFSGTPVKRTGRHRVVRNAVIAAGNSRDRSYVPRLVELLDDASPLVRGMAVWALSRLLRGDELTLLRGARADAEADPHVREEWARALPAPPQRQAGE